MSNRRKYYQWTEEDLKNALMSIETDRVGLNECSRRFKIPKPTLKRHLMKKNKYANDARITKGRPTVFSKEIEDELVKHLLTLELHMFGLTITDVRRLAFEIAEKNNIKHYFSSSKQMAGKSWFYKFMRRHPELNLKLESTSLNRSIFQDHHFISCDVLAGFKDQSVGCIQPEQNSKSATSNTSMTSSTTSKDEAVEVAMTPSTLNELVTPISSTVVLSENERI